jgi:hypothetical protein
LQDQTPEFQTPEFLFYLFVHAVYCLGYCDFERKKSIELDGAVLFRSVSSAAFNNRIILTRMKRGAV